MTVKSDPPTVARAREAVKSDPPTVARLREVVDSVYYFKDHFFEEHSEEEAGNKGDKVLEKKVSALALFDKEEETAEKEDRASYLYLRGRLLNVGSEFSADAESLLSRAVKLNPTHVEAWNELGESYTRKQDWPTARTCFQGALQHQKNKVSLRSLSMVLRQLNTTSGEEKVENIELGLARGKEAVGMDTADGVSWSILGNAYFSHFFLVSQNPKTLKQAMSAYTQAEKDIVSRTTPELHYNKGVALKYEEEFHMALTSFIRAQALDPTWSEPRVQETNLIKYLEDICSLIQLKGKLKAKKLATLIESIDAKDLGPYGGGLYKSPHCGSVRLQHIQSFSDLQPGLNTEKVILGKVIFSVFTEYSVPFTFCLMDRGGQCLVVTLYNLSPGKGVIIGDSVAISEPYLTRLDFSHKERTYKFDIVRVESPLVLIINGKKASRDLQAGVQITTFTKV